MPSVTDIRRFLQVSEVELQVHGKSEKVLAVCDSACNQSWIAASHAKRSNVKGKPTQQTIPELILTK